MNEQFTLGVLVHNRSGVLTRVSSLFSRRGFNIDSLTVGETENAEYSRMTITMTGDEYTREQIVKQLAKLVEVEKIRLMEPKQTVSRELMLIKIRVEDGSRGEIMEAVHAFRAKPIDFNRQSVVVEITGDTSKLSAFVEYVRPYGILEMCRTGISAIGRGASILKSDDAPDVSAAE